MNTFQHGYNIYYKNETYKSYMCTITVTIMNTLKQHEGCSV